MHPVFALLLGGGIAALLAPPKRKEDAPPPPDPKPTVPRESDEHGRLRRQNARLRKELRELKRTTGKVASSPDPEPKGDDPPDPDDTRDDEPDPKPADPGDNNEPHESGGEQQ